MRIPRPTKRQPEGSSRQREDFAPNIIILIFLGDKTMKILALSFSFILLLSFSTNSQTNIRDVDFKNFTYDADYCGGENTVKITVADGKFQRESSENTDPMYYAIYGIEYGDLDGDGREEAVILSMCNTGGTGNFTEAYIYKLQDRTPKRIMLLSGGDRAFGGLRKAWIRDQILIVESNDAGKYGGACCPEYIVTNRYKYSGKRLKEYGKSERRDIYPPRRVKFDRGKFGTTLKVKSGKDDNIKRFVVGAAKGQTLIVTKTSPDVYLTLRRGDAETLEEDSSLVAKLRETGDFVFEASHFKDRDLEFSMTITIRDSSDTSARVESIYTDLKAEKCRTIESSEEGAGYYRGKCKGVGGYELEVVEGDIRQSINIVQAASGDKWELDFWRVVSSAFSSVGDKAEWRVQRVNGKIKPIALIVRYNTNEDPENTEKLTSRLVITKIEGEYVCVTNIVQPVRNQNVIARQLADVARFKPCLTVK